MPRYFFHIIDNDGRTLDEEGMVLLHLVAVAREAEASTKDLLAHDLQPPRLTDNRRIEVVDENGNIVLVQLFKSLVQ